MFKTRVHLIFRWRNLELAGEKCRYIHTNRTKKKLALMVYPIPFYKDTKKILLWIMG